MNNKLFIWIVIIAAVSITVYSNTWNAGFVYDDYLYIVNNPIVHETSGIGELLVSGYARNIPEAALYRPVVSLSYRLNYMFDDLNPAGYHILNTMLHALVAIVIFIITRHIFHSVPAGLVAGLGFGLHPVHTEAVAWVVGRAEILSTLFGLLAFYYHVRAPDKWNSSKRMVSVFFFLLAIFSKENLVMLPVILFMYDLATGKISSTGLLGKIFRSYLIYIVPIIFWITARLLILGYLTPAGGFSLAHLGLIERFTTIVRVTGYYLFLQLIPMNLCGDYDFRIQNTLLSGSFILSSVLLLGTLIWILVFFRKYRLTVFFVLWFFVALVPVSNIVPIGEIIAERFLYFPGAGFSIGMGVIVAGIIRKQAKTWKRSFVLCLVFVFLTGSAFLTYSRNRVWESPKTFWTDVLLKSPNKTRPHVGIGRVYLEENSAIQAEYHFRNAIQLNTNVRGVGRAWLNLGVLYQRQKKNEDALQCFKEAKNYLSDVYTVFNNMGNVYLAQDQPEKAVAEFRHALVLEKSNPAVYTNMGNALQRTGEFEQALQNYNLALKLEPGFGKALTNQVFALNNWGSTLVQQGKTGDAIMKYRDAIALDPVFEGSYINLASMYMRMEKADDALGVMEKLLALDPLNVKALQFQFQVYTLHSMDAEKACQVFDQLEKTSIARSDLERLRQLYNDQFD